MYGVYAGAGVLLPSMSQPHSTLLAAPHCSLEFWVFYNVVNLEQLGCQVSSEFLMIRTTYLQKNVR